MNTDPEVTRIVRSWLRTDEHEVADRVLDNVLDLLDATPQRRAWWPARRLPHVNNPLRIALAAAAVIVVALIATNLLPRTTGVVAGAPSASEPSTTPALTTSPILVPTLPQSGQLAPGTYRSNLITYTLPAGWSAYNAWAANKRGGNPPDGMFLAPWGPLATVYGDPCHWQTTGVAVGRTVADAVAALAAQKGGSTVTAVDVTVDGFRGKQIDLMVPLSVKIADCDGSTYKRFTDVDGGDRYDQGPGQHDLLDILDVNGTTLLIDRVFYAANTADDLAELQAIFDSIKITH